MHNLIKNLYNIGLSLILTGCVAGTTPIAYQPTPTVEFTPTPTELPSPTPTETAVPTETPTLTQTEVPLTQPSPQISDKKLADFMNQYGTYLLTSYITLPQQAQEIVRWSEEVMHLNDLESNYNCMLWYAKVPNFNWNDARNCVNTLDSLLDELKNKVAGIGGYDWFSFDWYDKEVFERAEVELSKLSDAAEFEDTTKYDWGVSETRRILSGELYMNVIKALPAQISNIVPSPSSLSGLDYYMFTDNQQISSYSIVYDYENSSQMFGTFFVDEHNYAKRIFVFGQASLDLVGIFEYESPADTDAALNRLTNLVKFADQTFNIEGNEYQMIYWKVPEFNTNQYALFIKKDRFLMIADPDNEIKDTDNLMVRRYLTPLLE